MVLHLLGKKSWNVYNGENVERVRRDEAEAKAREDALDQRTQEEDAARRIAILRGEEPPALTNASEESANPAERKRKHDDGVPRKRRRLRDEDDTDRDIRYAREDAQAGESAKRALVKRDDEDAPLIDHAGNIQLIPAPDEKSIRRAEKNAEAEAEKAKKRKRDEDQFTMRFSNAAGIQNGMEKPWYAASKTGARVENATALPHVQDKDVWGREDPLRKEREKNRISSNDPFAAMQQAQRQLKQSEGDKEKWRKERAVEMEALRNSEDRRKKERKHRKRRDDEDSLEGFSLDDHPETIRERVNHDRHHRHHHRHHRRRSRSREKRR